MKMNEDGKTVAAMDCLVPGIGEIIGGSQREDSLEKLEARMDELGSKRRTTISIWICVNRFRKALRIWSWIRALRDVLNRRFQHP